jgi:hypothetical protein
MLLLLASYTNERPPLFNEGPLKVERKLLKEAGGSLTFGKMRGANLTIGSEETVELSWILRDCVCRSD